MVPECEGRKHLETIKIIGNSTGLDTIREIDVINLLPICVFIVKCSLYFDNNTRYLVYRGHTMQ